MNIILMSIQPLKLAFKPLFKKLHIKIDDTNFMLVLVYIVQLGLQVLMRLVEQAKIIPIFQVFKDFGYAPLILSLLKLILQYLT